MTAVEKQPPQAPSQEDHLGQDGGDAPADVEERGSIEEKADHIEDVEQSTNVGRPKLRGHCGRFWRAYSVCVVIFLAIFLPVLFLVIFPALFQLILSKIAVPVLSAKVSDATPSQVGLSLGASIKVPLGLTVRLDPVTLNLVETTTDTDDPYAQLLLPSQKLHGNAPINVPQQTAPLLNQTVWLQFLEQVLYHPKALLSFRSRIELHLAALHWNIRFNKDIAIAGFNNFSGIAVNDPKLVLPPASDGTNLLANVLLPNPTVITLALGNVSLIFRSGDLVLGEGMFVDLDLEPGNLSYPLRGALNFTTLIHNLPAFLQTQSAALKQGYLELTASGGAVLNTEGVHLPYFETVLGAMRLTAELSVAQLLMNTLGGLKPANETEQEFVAAALNAADINATALSGLELDKINVTALGLKMSDFAARHRLV